MIYGGPLLVINKTMTAILMARRISRLTGRNVVPVFWMGDEDHDFQEMSVLNLPDTPKLASFTLDLQDTGYTRVADLSLNGTLTDFAEQIREQLPETDFSKKLWELLDGSFKSGNDWGVAFGKLLAGLFSKHGLILAGSNDPDIKKFIQPVIIKAIQDSDGIKDSLEQQSKIFEKHQGRQAVSRHRCFFILTSTIFVTGCIARMVPGRSKMKRAGQRMSLWSWPGPIRSDYPPMFFCVP